MLLDVPEGSASAVPRIPSFFNPDSFAQVCARQFSLLEASKAKSSGPKLYPYKKDCATSSIYGDDSRRLVSALKSVGDPSDIAMLHRFVDEVGLVGFQGYLTKEIGRLGFASAFFGELTERVMRWSGPEVQRVPSLQEQVNKLESSLKALHDEGITDARQLKTMKLERETLKADKESIERERDALKVQVKSLRNEVSSLKDQVSSASELSDAMSKESDILRERLDRVARKFEEKLELVKAELLQDSPIPATPAISDIEERSTLLVRLEAIRRELEEKTEELEEAVGLARKFHECSFDNCLDQF